MTLQEIKTYYEENGLQALCDYLYQEDLYDSLYTEDYFKGRIQNELEDSVSNYNLIIHYAEAMQEYSETGYYIYDWSAGTLDTPTPVNSIEDLDLENYFE